MSEETRFQGEMIRMMNLVIGKVTNLETSFSELKSDVAELKSDVAELKADVSVLKSDVIEIKSVQREHSEILREHSKTLKEHSSALSRLENKTDIIAEVVLKNENRITKLENTVEDLQKNIH